MEATDLVGLEARFEEYRASGFLETAPSDVLLSNFTADLLTISAAAWALQTSRIQRAPACRRAGPRGAGAARGHAYEWAQGAMCHSRFR